jgi:hypothetical protein
MRIWRTLVLNGSLRPSRKSKDGEIPRRNESVRVNGVKYTPSVVWVATHEHERALRQRIPQIRFRGRLTGEALKIELM